MKLKNEQEIYELSMSKAHEIDPLAYGKGYTQAQQDLLASASEGFEEYCIHRIIRGTHRHERVFNAVTGNYLNLTDCEQLWQACSLHHDKKMQEKDEEIEKLKREKSIAIKSLDRVNKLLSNGEILDSSWIKDIIEIQSSNIDEEMRLKGVVLRLQKENQEMCEALGELSKEYSRIHEILCGGYEFYDDKSEDTIVKMRKFNLSETPNSSKEGL